MDTVIVEAIAALYIEIARMGLAHDLAEHAQAEESSMQHGGLSLPS
ncbi:hypothetical protein [Paraburkholderia humisilvae]|uniref:Uncharacterized protein n=1 Tax=Paraburkholderia humisilvae TaxID=627669 RepID=A0A6J5DCV2_9BURK|nr:hypothetical protein [Paraburkholderia humisilvae]CAB3752058.1 hypothetical protein LMG29542_01667 [Paraburkholderia humisilvae]